MQDASQPVVLPVSSDEVARVARVGDTVNVERYLVTALEELCVSMEVQLVADLDVLCVSRRGGVSGGGRLDWAEQRRMARTKALDACAGAR